MCVYMTAILTYLSMLIRSQCSLVGGAEVASVIGSLEWKVKRYLELFIHIHVLLWTHICMFVSCLVIKLCDSWMIGRPCSTSCNWCQCYNGGTHVADEREKFRLNFPRCVIHDVADRGREAGLPRCSGNRGKQEKNFATLRNILQ